MRTLSGLSLIAGLFAVVLGTNSVLAHEQKAEQPQSGMMEGQGMMGMMGMMQQMSEMMDACSKMMQAHADEEPSEEAPSQPQDQQ